MRGPATTNGSGPEPAGPDAGRRARAPRTRRPVPPATALERPALERAIREGTGRRLTMLVAGAGFGKSTLVARVVDGLPAAWYTVDATDRRAASLASGILEAIAAIVPGVDPGVLAMAATATPPTEAEALAAADETAAIVADALHEALDSDLVLVLDDVHELDGAPPAWKLVETLVRMAPPAMRFVLLTRTEPPFAVERLRGRGEVTDLGGRALAFAEDEIAELVRAEVDDPRADGVPDGGRPDDEEARRIAARIHAVTAGWPAAVRLAIEAVRSADPADRDAALDRLTDPEGPIFPYLAAEVVARASEETRELIATVAEFDRVTVPLCEALGFAGADRILTGLARRALFLVPLADESGWYTLHDLVREFCFRRLPLPEDRRRELHARAGVWFEATGMPEAALRSFVAADRLGEVARILRERGIDLVRGGGSALVIEAAEQLPGFARDPALDHAIGEALMVRGDWRGAVEAFRRAAGPAGATDVGTAWRLGLVSALRGDWAEAKAIYEGAVPDDATHPGDEAHRLAWLSSADRHLGLVAEARILATRAVELAESIGDERAMAAAHGSLGMALDADGEPHLAEVEQALAIAAAEQAGDVLQVIRSRVARGTLLIDLGRLDEAIDELGSAARLAAAAGFAPYHARALAERARAAQWLGRFEEALADLSAARSVYTRIGATMVVQALVNEGELHLLRGDTAATRAALDPAIAEARAADEQGYLAMALADLAQVVALDDPSAARVLVDEAVALGRALGSVTALGGAALVMLALDDRAAADRYATEAETLARARRERLGLARALELRGLAATDPREGARLVESAAELWREMGSPFGLARNRLDLAMVAEGDAARAAAVEAERGLRAYGARALAAEAARRLAELDRIAVPPVAVRTLGGFVVVRDGMPVPSSDWRSKKARDLLKILAARRGRPVPRETLYEYLWPDEDPEPLANRLSVALATVRSVLDPDKRFEADRFVGADRASVWLELEAIDLDLARFIAEVEAGRRLLRSGDRAGGLRRYEAAEALYAGDFLEEDPYEDWAVGPREEAQAAYVTVARALAEAAGSAGDADAATRFLLRILERDPFDEGAHLSLVSALLAAGRHGEARRRYAMYASRMAEIGVEAGPFPSPVGAAA